MIHECNINCRTMEPTMTEALGVVDPGKWLPFAFHMDIVDAIKMAADDDDSDLLGCTTIFTATGDAYIIDTQYKKFLKLFIQHNKNQIDE